MKIKSFNKQNKKQLSKIISNVYSDDSTPEYIANAILDRLLWMATENDDYGKKVKYKGQRYWSEGAINQIKENKKNGKYYIHNLRHEHSIPKKEIKNMILTSDKSQSSIFGILDMFAHSVIVSKSEDQELNNLGLRSKMPRELKESYDSKNIFSRYIEIGINIYDIKNEDPRNIRISDLKNYSKII